MGTDWRDQHWCRLCLSHLCGYLHSNRWLSRLDAINAEQCIEAIGLERRFLFHGDLVSFPNAWVNVGSFRFPSLALYVPSRKDFRSARKRSTRDVVS